MLAAQANDSRFVNASVEFDVATLRPTYRLMWGSAGVSHALAVAEGLKFDPLVIAEARRIAAGAGADALPGGNGGDHALAVQVRLPVNVQSNLVTRIFVS